MSTLTRNIPTTKKAAKAYIRFGLLAHPHILDVYVKGSRSPENPKKARRDSDWDLVAVVAKGKKVVLASPSLGGWLHADVYLIPEGQDLPTHSVHWKKVIKS